MCVIKSIESRFVLVTGSLDNLSKYPIKKEESKGFRKDKDKARDFAEVFTPLHIVDSMIDSIPSYFGRKTLDLCAGHGQFTIRLLRKFSKVKGFNVKKYLKERHFFSELQIESCIKLLWIFGTDINLAIGDALKLDKLPPDWRGVWVYIEQAMIWVDITNIVKSELDVSGSYDSKFQKKFEEMIEGLRSRLNKIAKEPNMELERLITFPTGRKLLKDWVRKVATEQEENWQNIETPEWIAKEMVQCIPDLKTRSKFLVLFNIELLEALVTEGVPISKIIFGSDSLLEESMIQGLYKAKTFHIGRSFDDLKKALEEQEGQYDVVLSNPPYQVNDGGHGASARPIYHEIVQHAIDKLGPQYVCMITPSRWMMGGKGLDDYRARMLSDKRLKLIQDFPGTNDVFSSVSIAGGVSYFLWDRDHNGLCEFNGINRDIGEFDVLIRDNTSISILKKVIKTHSSNNYLCSIVSSSKPYGFREDTIEQPAGTPCWFKQSRGLLFVDPQLVKDSRNDLNKWKVLSPRTIPGADVAKMHKSPIEAIHATNMFIAKPGECCSESYLVLNSFNKEKEAIIFRNYVKTRFFRFMLLLRVISQDVTREKFSWVPDLGDYTQPVTDQDLYEHFSLTKKEIAHIESTIKELK
jgi:hypothetical protein